jgi:superfamily II DNA or RNA helicase
MFDFDKVVGTTALEPRPYQKRIVQKAVDMFRGRHLNQKGLAEKNAKTILIESPTGSGKTSMGLMTARGLQEEIPDLQVAWIAMRKNLLGQAERENVSKAIGVKNIQFVSMFCKDPAELFDRSKPLLVVSDEGHHDAAGSMAHIHCQLQSDFVLGLSATPFRCDDLKLCFEKVIKDAGIHRLIADGYLSTFDHYTIDDWSPETVAARYLSDVERWGKSIFYFLDLERCERFNRLLLDAGIRSDVVTGSTDVDSQAEAFADGRLQVLVNCMKLTEGFDCPDLKTVWVRDGSRGPTMQMAGRVLRRHKDLPIKQIVQSKLTKYPFLKVANPRYQYQWEDCSWRSLTINKDIELINLNARYAIATQPVAIPKFIRDRAWKVAKRVSSNDVGGI